MKQERAKLSMMVEDLQQQQQQQQQSRVGSTDSCSTSSSSSLSAVAIDRVISQLSEERERLKEAAAQQVCIRSTFAAQCRYPLPGL
jgi:hypothetical protein